MDYSVLSQAPLFKGFTSGETEKIISSIRHQVRKYKSGSVISQSGEPVSSLMIVINGVVKGEMVDYAGRVIKIEDIPAPGALASAFMFGNRNRFPVNVIATTDAELLIIDKPEFLRLLRKDDRILVNFLDMISNRSQFLSEKIKFLNFKTIKGKLAHYILQKAGKEGASVILDMTQNDLADYFGVARPSVGRALSELEDDGFIEAKGKSIKITNKEKLSLLSTD
ncbi:MAG: Crp/Fnr family transcriptional regulator [Odoribacter sp.]|nr:Crp/Fnr family transcriptional regulator [Odoribacter sp.]